MKKSTVFTGIIFIISAAIYNIVVFVAFNGSTAKFWCGYAFTMAAFLLQILFAFIAFGKADSLKKTFLGLPVAELGLTYLILQLILGLIVMFVPVITAKIGSAASAVLLGIYLIAIISAAAGRNMVTEAETKVQSKTFRIKAILSDVESMTLAADDALLKKSLKMLEDVIRYSDPISSDALAYIENKIEAKVAELGEIVNTGNIEQAEEICKAIELLFNERNKKSKLAK